MVTSLPRAIRRIAAAVLLLAGALALGTGSAGAGTITHSGTWDGSQPTMPVITISTPSCGIVGATPVAYEVIPYTPLLDGDVDLSITNTVPGLETSVYVFEGTFTPGSATGCIAASNNGSPPSTPTTLTFTGVAGTEYQLVLFNDTFAQTPGAWELTIDTVPAAYMTVDITTGGPFRPGDTVPFEVTVENLETDDAVDAEVVVTLPAGFDPASIAAVTAGGSPLYGCVTDATAGTLTCTAASHPVGATATISFTAGLLTTVAPGQLAVTAEVSIASPPNANAAGSSAVASVVVEAPTTTTTAPAGEVVPAFTG